MVEQTKQLFCSTCGGSGLLGLERLCPACEGAGTVAPMVISLPLLTPSDAMATDSRWWSRLAVLCADERDGRLGARGICDTGVELTVRVRPDALAAAPRITFVEIRRRR